MSDDYLWDRSGEFDPQIQKLESALAVYRYVELPNRGVSGKPARAAVAAGLAVIAAATFWMSHRPLSEWRIAGARVAVGKTVETGGTIGATLQSDSFGEVKLSPNSRLQILPSSSGNQHLSLQRGTMHALIWAPPAKFRVDTPSAAAIDLGCSYTLSVLPDDSGLLTVDSGWVAFQDGPAESFIPAGAACRTRPRMGPGLPYFESASTDLREAISKFDSSAGAKGLDGVLFAATTTDALTLWHLAVRTSGGDRERVIRRFAELVPGIDEAGLNAGQSKAVDEAWNLLGLGGADWWRMWKHSWRAQ